MTRWTSVTWLAALALPLPNRAISRYSQVRVEKLRWKNLGSTQWVEAHGRKTWAYRLDLGCNLRRSWRFLVKQFASRSSRTRSAR